MSCFPGVHDCRGAELRKVFGRLGAPRWCGPCHLAKRRVDLGADGFVCVPQGHRQGFQECGVLLEFNGDEVWAPAWAEMLRRELEGSTACIPVLKRAVSDRLFRNGCETIARLTGEDYSASTGLPGRLSAYARLHGVEMPDPPPDPLLSAPLVR